MKMRKVLKTVKDKGFMIKFSFFIILFLMVVISSVNAKTPDIVLEQKNAVVSLYVNDKNGRHIFSGNGFIVGQMGVIAASCHLISKWLEKIEYTLVVKMGDAYFPMEYVISNNCNNNLVLIKIKADDLPTVNLAAGHKPKHGESIMVMDRSSGSEAAVSDGVIRSVRLRDEIFQVSVPITPERDGSPVFNLKGEVVGISTLLPGKRRNQHIVIPVKYVSREFNKYKHLIKETSALPS